MIRAIIQLLLCVGVLPFYPFVLLLVASVFTPKSWGDLSSFSFENWCSRVVHFDFRLTRKNKEDTLASESSHRRADWRVAHGSHILGVWCSGGCCEDELALPLERRLGDRRTSNRCALESVEALESAEQAVAANSGWLSGSEWLSSNFKRPLLAYFVEKR